MEPCELTDSHIGEFHSITNAGQTICGTCGHVRTLDDFMAEFQGHARYSDKGVYHKYLPHGIEPCPSCGTKVNFYLIRCEKPVLAIDEEGVVEVQR